MKFEAPEVIVLKFAVEDVITTSYQPNENETPDGDMEFE